MAREYEVYATVSDLNNYYIVYNAQSRRRNVIVAVIDVSFEFS